jgi:hypothetical protein
MKHMKHWQDPVTGLLGVWLVLSPWLLSFQDQRTAMANFVVVGVLLVAAAVNAIMLPRAWEEWTEVVLGAWLVASPWVLGFASHMTAVQVALFTGVAVLVLSLWVLATDKDYGGWWNRLVG